MKPKKFKFKLQSILELKKKKEDAEKEKLARLFNKLSKAEKKLADYKIKEKDTKLQMRQKQRKGGLDVEELKRHHYYLEQLADLIENQKVIIEQIKKEVEEQRQVLIKATQEKKTYEKLKEKHKKKFDEEQTLTERKFIDELATTRYHRKKRVNG